MTQDIRSMLERSAPTLIGDALGAASLVVMLVGFLALPQLLG